MHCPAVVVTIAAATLALTSNAFANQTLVTNGCVTQKTATNAFAAARTIAIRTPRSAIAVVPMRTLSEQERGLMCVTHLATNRGMLFVFGGNDRMLTFWMKDTLLDLDIIFISHDGTITRIAHATHATSTNDADLAIIAARGNAVIELGAGQAAKHALTTGYRLPESNWQTPY